MYSTWTVSRLKDELRRRGASLRGRKADLVSRLESFDRNFNFNIPQQDSETEDAKMCLPAPEFYHDINSSTALPTLTKQHIRYYFNEFNKKPDNGLRLYESRFLIVIRSYTENEYTFIKAIGKAAMKRLQYEINLKIHASGNIEESSCECVAGSGTTAHCKHVAMGLFAVEHMVREKTIIKHETPTEKLQKFHVPKSAFNASPLKSSRLPSKRKMENIIFSPCTMEVDTIEYNQKFRSLIVNYPSSTMPLKQLYEPANPHAIELDHRYIEDTSEKVLKKLNLRNITAELANAIEEETRGQALNNKWIKYREDRITGSKFHTICNLKEQTQSKFANQILEQRQFFSRATNHGVVNEKVALRQYMEEFNLEVIPCGLFISLERPYLAASPDGLLGDETLVEIKCPYTNRNEKIDDITVPYLVKGEMGDLKLKYGSPYYYQIQGQMYCTGRKYCNLIIYTFKEMRVIYVDRDEEFINGMLLKLDHFYYSHFKQALLNKYVYKNYLDIIKKN